jgi:uncharacterized protein involved in exopolysaccharide biosynthesis
LLEKRNKEPDQHQQGVEVRETITEDQQNTKMQQYTQGSYYFIRLVTRHSKQFLIVTVLAVVCAALFSSSIFIKPKYRSNAIVYPANITPYSSESESEQMLQLFQSADVRDAVIRKFKLDEYYQIDTTTEGGKADLISTYDGNVEISRTQFESVEIKVLDTDPKMACAMVNEIIAAMNAKARNLQRSKAMEVVKVFADEVRFKKEQIDSLNTILEELRIKYQILDYKSQAKEVTRAWMRSLQSGKGNIKDIDVMVRNLGEKGGEYYEAKEVLDGVLAGYNKARADFDIAWRDMNKNISYANIVTRPVIADKKTYPIRWLIVVVSVVAANLFVLGIILLQEERRKMRL